MPDYIVDNCPLRRNGKDYGIGKTVTMPEKDAEPLLALGVIKPAASSAGSDGEVTREEIIQAIGRLDPGNKDLWTSGGKPQVSAIEAVLGKQISAGDRDAAWDVFNGGE